MREQHQKLEGTNRGREATNNSAYIVIVPSVMTNRKISHCQYHRIVPCTNSHGTHHVSFNNWTRKMVGYLENHAIRISTVSKQPLRLLQQHQQ